MPNCGLTLGKFAPLHRGHRALIECALAEVDHLIVIPYDAPETTSIPLTVRADWIRTLYPDVSVIEGWNGPTEVGYTPEVMRAHERFVLGLLDGRSVTHFYSSEPYGEHMSRALGAEDRRFDPARAAVPISGTRIRENPFAHREWLHPYVYRDHVSRIVLLGAPSTGKTTLAEALAGAFDTRWMPEYGREYWETHQVGRRLTAAQLLELATEHRTREEALLLDSNRFLFVDTDARTTAHFAVAYHGRVEPALAALADEATRRADLVILCEDDIPYDDTPDRSGEGNRAMFQQRHVADLRARGVPFLRVWGSLEERVARVRRALACFEKYGERRPELGEVER